MKKQRERGIRPEYPMAMMGRGLNSESTSPGPEKTDNGGAREDVEKGDCGGRNLGNQVNPEQGFRHHQGVAKARASPYGRS